MAKKRTTAKAGRKSKAKEKTGPKVSKAGQTGQKAMRIPNDNEVRNACSSVASLKKTARSAAGDVGQKVADLVKNKHFNAKALKDILGARDMPDEKFAIWWTHFGVYAKALGFDRRAELASKGFGEADKASAETAAKDLKDDDADLRPRHARNAVVPLGDAAAAATDKLN